VYWHYNVRSDVIPLRQPEAKDDGLVVAIAQPFRRIAPGTYEARSMTIRRRSAYKRTYLEAFFQIFDGPATSGRVLGRVPAFFPLPPHGRELAPSANLTRWIQLLGMPSRRDRVPLRTLENKLWKVEVVDVVHDRGADGKRRPLAESQKYSKIGAVLERLA
jgi:hypothetical protein